jgi:hypothetical protein
LRALAALGAVLVTLAAPAAASAACPSKLPVRVALPDGPYAAGYTKDVRVTVDAGARGIANLRGELYTFSGQRLGAGRARRWAAGTVTLSLRLARDYRPLQAGGFTLVLKGDPRGACGEREATRVLRFRACRETLPLRFGPLPGGVAADYGGWLSVPVRAGGNVMRNVTSAVYGFDGTLLGRAARLPALFGGHTLDHKLRHPLTPGSYTVVVEGLVAEQPAACGRKRAQATLTFK